MGAVLGTAALSFEYYGESIETGRRLLSCDGDLMWSRPVGGGAGNGIGGVMVIATARFTEWLQWLLIANTALATSRHNNNTSTTIPNTHSNDTTVLQSMLSLSEKLVTSASPLALSMVPVHPLVALEATTAITSLTSDKQRTKPLWPTAWRWELTHRLQKSEDPGDLLSRSRNATTDISAQRRESVVHFAEGTTATSRIMTTPSPPLALVRMHSQSHLRSNNNNNASGSKATDNTNPVSSIDATCSPLLLAPPVTTSVTFRCGISIRLCRSPSNLTIRHISFDE